MNLVLRQELYSDTDFALCLDTLGQPQIMTELINSNKNKCLTVRIRHEGCIFHQVTIPPGGSRFAVMCCGKVVVLVSAASVKPDGETMVIFDGGVIYELTPDNTHCPYFIKEYPIIEGATLSLYRDGSMKKGNLPCASATGYPVAYIRDDSYVDSVGRLVYEEPDKWAASSNLRKYLFGIRNGRVAVTSDRKLVAYHDVQDDIRRVVDVVDCACQVYALTASGYVYQMCTDHSGDEPEDYWVRLTLGFRAKLIASYKNVMAIAGDHCVLVYEKTEADSEPALTGGGIDDAVSYITDIAVGQNHLAVMYLDGSWEVRGWRNDEILSTDSHHNVPYLWKTRHDEQ